MISHVLSCIGDTPVGSNENLVQAFNSFLCLNKATERNNPTSFIGSFFLESKGTLFFQEFEGCSPETPLDDIGFPVEEIIEDGKLGQSLQMSLNNFCRQFLGKNGDGMGASLNLMKNFIPPLLKGGTLLNFGLETGIEVPAEVIEGLALRSLRPEISEIGQSFGVKGGIQIEKGCHHIDHLNSRIVDIITNLRWKTEPFQNPGYRISDHSIPEVTNMHRFIGIDTRVFDEDLLFLCGSRFSEKISFFENLGHQISC